MPIVIDVTVEDNECPAGTCKDAVIQIKETGTRHNAGGWKFDIEGGAIGAYAKLVTGIPFISWCDYKIVVKNAVGNFKHMTYTLDFEDCTKDKSIDVKLKKRKIQLTPTENLVMDPPPPIDPPPPPPIDPPPPIWPTTDPGPEPNPLPTTIIPPRSGGLLAIYKVEGLPVSGMAWAVTGISGSESGVTNSLGEVRITDTGSVTLFIDDLRLGDLQGPELVTINVTDVYE